MMQRKQLLASALAVATLLAACGRADAVLMVYEGFEGYDTSVQLKGQLASPDSIGLDQTSAWQSSSTTQQWFLVSGLAFGSGDTQLQTSGGAIQRENSVSSSVSAKFDIAASNLTDGQFVGTMYASYLVQQTGTGTGINGNAHVVVFDGGSASANTRRFRAGAATGTLGGVGPAIDSPVGVDYVGNSFIEGTGTTNVNNETFIILSRFTQVGQAIDPLIPSTHGVGTVWALTSDQFDYFKTNDWADIDTAAVGSGSTDVRGKSVNTHTTALTGSATNLLNNTAFWTIGSGSTAANNNVKFDELRMGTSFDDVTPVVAVEPEVLVGDFNNDNIVNLADYTVWRDNLGAETDAPINEAGDGVPGVTAADYDEWKGNFGAEAAPPIAAFSTNVPEPSSLLLATAVIGIALLAHQAGGARRG